MSALGVDLHFKADAWSSTKWEWKLPLLESKVTMHWPGILFSSLLWFGVGTFSYWIGKKLSRFGQDCKTYFKSMTNASKYVSSKIASKGTPTGDATADSTPRNRQAYSAVIYGAGTKVGQTFANYLAKKGFNLILVERDLQSLENLEVSLNVNNIVDPIITKIVLDKFSFDMDTFQKQVVGKLKAHKGPVKIFINCKNSRRKLTNEQVNTQQHLLQLQEQLGESLMLD